MGLLYIMPVSEEESDRIQIIETPEGKLLHVKSYGLPLIFWGYLLAILSMIFIMVVAIYDPLTKVLSGADEINRVLGFTVLATLLMTPLTLLALLLLRKVLSKNNNELIITHKVFWLPLWRTKLTLKTNDAFTLEHYLDSPNMARLQNKDEMRGFANRGYFELFAILNDGRYIRIDRSSQRYELTKLKDFLSRF